MQNNRCVGSNYEDFAAKFLLDKGYNILKMNFRCKGAEVDIIAKDNNTLVFIEVKYRTNDKTGHPLEAVDFKKQLKISKAAVAYLNMCKIPMDLYPIRFDVIGILGEEVIHIKNAFEYVC